MSTVAPGDYVLVPFGGGDGGGDPEFVALGRVVVVFGSGRVAVAGVDCGELGLVFRRRCRLTFCG